MPPKAQMTREKILSAAVELIRSEGVEKLNARSLAAALHCSTNPVFRLFKNMEDLKTAVRKELDRIYNGFMDEHIDPQNRLITQGTAYVEFARQEPEFFRALFLDRCMMGADLDQIAHAWWNRETIENVAALTQLGPESAQRVFIHVWLFSHGMASQLISNGIVLPPEEVYKRHEMAFLAFSRLEREQEETKRPPTP